VDDDDNRKWKEDDMYSDAWDRSTPAQSLPAGAVALSRARSTNPEIFRRGWKSAGPPGPELLPDMDDSERATHDNWRTLHVGRWIGLFLRHRPPIMDIHTKKRRLLHRFAAREPNRTTAMPPDECMVLQMGPGHDAAWMI